jgi:hypothetical protein
MFLCNGLYLWPLANRCGASAVDDDVDNAMNGTQSHSPSFISGKEASNSVSSDMP